MKKLVFVFGALILGFMISSCDNSAKVKAGMIKDVDEYFTEAERVLNEFDNAEDFVAFAKAMNDRSDLLEHLSEKYGDNDITDKDWDEVESFMYDRATAYNQAEMAKCSEFLTPIIDRFEVLVNNMYPKFLAGETFDDATIDEYADVYTAIMDFGECENVDSKLVDRLEPLFAKDDEMTDVILARLDEMYPDESE